MNAPPAGRDRSNKARLWSQCPTPSRGGSLLRFIQLAHRGMGLLVAVGLLFHGPVSQAHEGDLTLAASTGVASRYVYRGVERSTEAWQTGLAGSVDGWRGQLWSNRPFDTAEPEEIQSSLGYVWMPGVGLTLEASGTHFWYVDPPVNGAAAHSFEGAMQVTWNRSDGWRPGVCFAYDIRFRSRTIEASLAYDMALKTWGTFLGWRTYAGYLVGDDVLPDTTGAAVRDGYSYFGMDVRLPYRIAATTELVLEAHFADTVGQNPLWSPLSRGAGARGWLTFAVRFEF